MVGLATAIPAGTHWVDRTLNRPWVNAMTLNHDRINVDQLLYDTSTLSHCLPWDKRYGNIKSKSKNTIKVGPIVGLKQGLFYDQYLCFAGVFIALGLTGVIPAIHFVTGDGLYHAFYDCGLGWLLLMAALYIIGALLYACRIPEKYYPGMFDIWVSVPLLVL